MKHDTSRARERNDFKPYHATGEQFEDAKYRSFACVQALETTIIWIGTAVNSPFDPLKSDMRVLRPSGRRDGKHWLTTADLSTFLS